MKQFLLLLLLISSTSVLGQDLHYFTTKDSVYIGVKKGDEIIVPLEKHRITYYVDFKEPIITPIFELPGNNYNKPIDKVQPAMPANTVYNLQGKPLYYTLWFDNGSDYFQEDAQRIFSMDTGKVGFANDEGTIIVEPTWDFASPFNYGYAEIMYDVKRKYVDDEHWTVVANSEKAFTGYVNKTGQLVKPYAEHKHPKDYKINDFEYLPYPFSYTKKESEILDDFKKYYEALNDISLNNLYTQGTKEEVSLQFEIIRKPSKYFPYYKIQAYRRQYIDDSYTFVYNDKTKQFYFFEYPFNISDENLIPIETYIVNRLTDICDEQQKKEFERQFVFDACQKLKQWQQQ